VNILVCDRKVPAIATTRPTLATVLEELGHTVVVTADGPVDLSGHDVIVEWGNPGYFPRLRRQLLRTPRDRRPLVAVVHAEPLPPPRASGLPRWAALSPVEIAKIVLRDWRATDIYSNARTLRRMMREGTIDVLFATSREKLEYFREEGYEARFVPYGYHASFGRMLGLERDIPVLFLGDTRPLRRRRQLWYLKRHGVDVTVRGSWHDPALWGADRTHLLNRTRIVVHLQRYPGKVAAKRLILALANGALVVSEPTYHPEPFVDGVHFVEAPIERMPETIRYYLEHPAERDRIVEAGHRLVTEELTFTRSVETMLDVIRQRVRMTRDA
jgi:hypothetical protein